MLARSFRLQKKDIDRLYKKGKVLRQDNFLLRIMVNHTDHCRFAIVISKKVLPHAVDRNRARRLMFDFLQKNPDLYSGKNLDIAIYPKSIKEDSIVASLNKLLSELR